MTKVVGKRHIFLRTAIEENEHVEILMKQVHKERYITWVYIFLKNPYLSKSRFMRCFRNFKTSSKF